MNEEITRGLIDSIKIVNNSVEEAISENRDYVTMDIVDAIEVKNTLGMVIAYE